MYLLLFFLLFFFNNTATTEIYPYCHTLSLPDALPISGHFRARRRGGQGEAPGKRRNRGAGVYFLRRPNRPDLPGSVGSVGSSGRSEEHTSELQSLMRISYAVFCLKKKKNHK